MSASHSPHGLPENIGVEAVVIPELKFSDIQRQIFCGNLVIGTDNAALQDRPEAFDGLGMDGTANILPARMVNGFVRVVAVQMFVANPFVGAEQADLGGNAFVDECFEGAGTNVPNHAGDDVALAANGTRQSNILPRAASGPAAAALVPMPVLGLTADEGFVNLDNSHELAEIFVGKARADPVCHVEGGPVRPETERPVDLVGGNPLFAGEHQVDDAEPVPQRLVRVLEDGPCQMRGTG